LVTLRAAGIADDVTRSVADYASVAHRAVRRPPAPPASRGGIGLFSLTDSVCSETERALKARERQLERNQRERYTYHSSVNVETYRDGRRVSQVRSDTVLSNVPNVVIASRPRVYVNVEPNFAVPINGESAYTWEGAGVRPTTRMYRAAELDASDRALEAARTAIARQDHARTAAELTKASHKLRNFRRALDEYVYNPRPVPARVDTAELRTLLVREFNDRGITTPFELAVQQGKPTMSLAALSPARTGVAPSTYSAELFTNDLKPQGYHAVVRFTRQAGVIYSLMGQHFLISGVFLLIICLGFAYTVRTILHQKKLSEMKTDFINNMTHEFKTPIATISLATEAINEPRVQAQPEKMTRFVGVIQTENKRLQGQVERVLQMAEIERGTARMNTSSVDAAELLSDAIAKLSMQVEKRGGLITLNAHARHTQVKADPMHLGNIFFNLLDNANKYSRETPSISVTTSNAGNSLRIAVQDRGIGMTEAQQRRIFESFYRVPTGNLHDVKGFGLGLAYVKSMVEAHGGTVEVRSELGKGSRFEIILPLLPTRPSAAPLTPESGTA